MALQFLRASRLSPLKCPGCGKCFDEARILRFHCRATPWCASALALAESNDIAQRTAARKKEEATKADEVAGDKLLHTVLEDERRARVGADLSELRFDRNMADSNIAAIKVCVRRWMSVVEKQLVQVLWEGNPKAADREKLAECLNLFNGLETQGREDAFLRTQVPYIEPVRVVLGNSEVAGSLDEEGISHASRSRQGACYTIPISEHVCRLLQHDARAWEHGGTTRQPAPSAARRATASARCTRGTERS